MGKECARERERAGGDKAGGEVSKVGAGKQKTMYALVSTPSPGGACRCQLGKHVKHPCATGLPTRQALPVGRAHTRIYAVGPKTNTTSFKYFGFNSDRCCMLRTGSAGLKEHCSYLSLKTRSFVRFEVFVCFLSRIIDVV